MCYITMDGCAVYTYHLDVGLQTFVVVSVVGQDPDLMVMVEVAGKVDLGAAGLARVEVEGASAILGNMEPQIGEIHFLRCPAPDECLL